MGYRISAPMFFDIWELPAVRVGDEPTGGVVACGVNLKGVDRTTWRVRITGYYAAYPRNNVLYDANDAVRTPVREYGWGRQAREVIVSVLSFLRADAESYRRTMGAVPPPDGWIFNAVVAEWAYINNSELDAVADLLAGAR